MSNNKTFSTIIISLVDATIFSSYISLIGCRLYNWDFKLTLILSIIAGLVLAVFSNKKPVGIFFKVFFFISWVLLFEEALLKIPLLENAFETNKSLLWIIRAIIFFFAALVHLAVYKASVATDFDQSDENDEDCENDEYAEDEDYNKNEYRYKYKYKYKYKYIDDRDYSDEEDSDDEDLEVEFGKKHKEVYADEYENEYKEVYADEYENEYEEVYADEYENEYDDSYANEYEEEYEDSYANEYEEEYDDIEKIENNKRRRPNKKFNRYDYGPEKSVETDYTESDYIYDREESGFEKLRKNFFENRKGKIAKRNNYKQNICKEKISNGDNYKQQNSDKSNDGKYSDYYVENDIVSRLFLGCNDKESLVSRYRSLMKTFHPDTGNGDLEMSQEIQKKYRELMKKFE